jgi:hypothetical protein
VQADAPPLAGDRDLTPLLVLVETARRVCRGEVKREVECGVERRDKRALSKGAIETCL